MKQFYDVAVIGAGPSGASAAFHLAKKGINTILIEKETLPRYKTCGGGFFYRGLRQMHFDVSKVIEREFCEVDIQFGAKNLAFHTQRKQPIISMIMRDRFDYLMAQNAEKLGVTLLQGAALKALEFQEHTTKLITDKETVEARFVIAADGALSPTAKLAGWEETRMMCPALEYEIEVPVADFKRLSSKVRFDMDVVPLGYGWCFPKANHLSIGVGNFMKGKKAVNLKEACRNYFKHLEITEIHKEEAHGFIIPITPRTDGFIKENVFLTGDAAGFADPITAEGISNAIYSGLLVAESIAKSNLNLAVATKNYQDKLEEKLLPELRVSASLSKLFYGQKTFRNILLKKYGDYAAEYMTDIFMGDRFYPTNIMERVKAKIGI